MIINQLIMLNKGYTMRQAAFAVGRSAPHVCAVIKGARKSETLVKKLLSLPVRELKLRRPRNEKLNSSEV